MRDVSFCTGSGVFIFRVIVNVQTLLTDSSRDEELSLSIIDTFLEVMTRLYAQRQMIRYRTFICLSSFNSFLNLT